tara:strand:- start:312 stop:719 length:408 start_codon:yes stop_codon:yes gene_type:complete
MIKYIKIAFILQVFLLLTSCYDKDSLAGEYSGMCSLGDIEITLKDDGTFEKTLISDGNSPWGVTGKKGHETTTYGVWKCDMKYFTSRYNGKGTCRKLWMKVNNSSSSNTFDVEENWWGWHFVDRASDGDVLEFFD